MPDRTLDQLPVRAMSNPRAAAAQARSVLAASPSPREATYALHALGIIERDNGQVGHALRHFRRGLRLARDANLADRASDLGASLGTALALSGRRQEALRAFDDAMKAAADNAEPGERGRVLMRRGAARAFLGDVTGAYEDSMAALDIFTALGDPVWECRARQNAGAALVGLGRFDEADLHLAAAQKVAEDHGDAYSAAVVLNSRGDCAQRMGRLPEALRMLYEAQRRHERLGVIPPEIIRDLAVVQLSAGLTDEASSSADHLVHVLEQDHASALRRADGFIAAAIVHLGAGSVARAIDLARRAQRSSRRQGHAEAEQHARFVLLRARAQAGQATARHAHAAAALAAELSDRFSSERLDALVLAGRLALSAGLDQLARSSFESAAAERRRGSAVRRAAAWYAQAQLAAMRGDRAGMLRACTRGLDILDEYTLSLGALELRARASIHSTDLAVLATRAVAESGTARQLLRWTERWRSTVHALPMPPAPDDPVLAADLGRLRAASRDVSRLADSRQDSRRHALEERIRRHVHARPGDPSARRRDFDVATLLDELDTDTTLVSIIGIKGGNFHISVAGRGQVRHLRAGRVEAVHAELDYARFALRSAVLSPASTAEHLLTTLEHTLHALERTILGPATRHLGDGALILVPPARLQAAPWGALPALRGRAVAVAPSATAWMRARTSDPVSRASTASAETALIAGSGLRSSASEISRLRALHPEATVLTGADATVEAALRAMDGAGLVHISAHGHFRGDSPMFSSLELADGPVTVLDLERLSQPPHRLILTACESGVGSATGTDELLGLANTLGVLGTTGILASIVPVSDAASVPLSVTVHERLHAGDDLPSALLAARTTAEGPVEQATAWSFLALGAH